MPSPMLPSDWISIMGAAGSTVLGAWGIAWWLSKQFSNMRGLFFDRMEAMQKAIMDKLEYHERHDDQRFNSINNDIWAIKVRNATIDGHRAAKTEE